MAASGDNRIAASGDYVTINAGDGDDTINGGFSTDAIINAGGGNNYIEPQITNASITAGAGNDTITTHVGNITIDAGDGSDTIINFNEDDTLQIGDGTTDTYSTLKSGTDVVVYVGEETILLKGAASLSAVNILGSEVIKTSVTLTDNADTYTNDHAGVTVSALGGDDTITNNGANTSISGGDGNYTLVNNTTGEGSTLDGGAGNDSISNSGDNVSISGGAYNDTIINEGANVTIDGGYANDSISLSASATNNLIVYNPGSGGSSDTIEGFNEDDTLQIGDGETDTYIRSTVNRNDILISLRSAGSVLLIGAATLDNVNIAGEEYNSLRVKLDDYDNIYTSNYANMTVLARGGDDSIVNYGANVLIDGSAGNDTIISHWGDNSTLLGGDGNDIINNNGQFVTIDGGDGNDTLETVALYASVFGGDGDDVISLDASSNVTTTLNGGAGNDTIYGKFNSRDSHILFEYSAGDGNDEIHEFNAGDTLKIGDGTATYYSLVEGDDVVVHAGDGSVVLKGAASLASVNIAGVESVPAVTGTDGDDVIQVSDNGSQVSSGDGNDTIKVGANVTTFTVTDFAAGDAIELNSSVEAIVAADGSIVAGNVTIGGVTAANEDFALTLDDGTVAYVKTSSDGAKLSDDGTTIIFASAATETLLTIDGLDADLTDDALTAGVNVDGNKIILSADVLAKKKRHAHHGRRLRS